MKQAEVWNEISRQAAILHGKQMEAEARLSDEILQRVLDTFYPEEPCYAPDDFDRSADSFSMTFEGVYATAEEEMEEWRKILHGE